MTRPGRSSTRENSDAVELDGRADELEREVPAAELENAAPESLEDAEPEAFDDAEPESLENAAPEPLEHAAPDSELAEAQLAIGRPELVPEAGGEDEADSEDEFELEAEDAAQSFEDHEEDPGDPNLGSTLVGGGVRPVRRRRGASADGDDGAAAELEVAEAHVPAGRANIFSRLIHFVQGSWRELQRVQWPDRRQVMQATGVVIGFVIVAGVFLGVADFLAGKLVNFILK